MLSKNDKNLMILGLFTVLLLALTTNTSASPSAEVYRNDVLGIEVQIPEGMQVHEHQYLSDVFGFSVIREDRDQVFQVGWHHKKENGQLDQLVEQTVTGYPGLEITKKPIKVGDYEGVMLSPVPGMSPHTLVYVAVNERLYELRYMQESLDELGGLFFANIKFLQARTSLADINLPNADDMLYLSPPDDLKIEEGSKSAPLPQIPEEELNKVLMEATISSVQSGCTEWWTVTQTQWSSAANNWSGQSTAGPSFFGQGLHVDCNSSSSYNDFYALDHSLKEWDAIWPHKAGTVIFAGWAGGGWSTLGRMVIIDYGGNHWGVMAHLRGFMPTAQVGNYVYSNTSIGYAGGSGNWSDGYWGIHLHQSLNLNATLHSNPNGIYGGQSVRPTYIWHDADGGGYYYGWSLYQGMPMKY